MSQGWIAVDKQSGKPLIKRKVQTITDTVQANLSKIVAGQSESVPDKEKSEYKKRKLMSEQVLKVVQLTRARASRPRLSRPRRS